MDALHHHPTEGDIPSIHKKHKLSTLPNFAPNKLDKNRESEIDRLVDTLKRATQVREAHHATPAQDVAIPTILEAILDRMWDVVDPAEKLAWISKDILKVLITTICLNARRSQPYGTAIEICRNLITDSRECSTAFSRTVLSHMTADKECMGVSDCLFQLINTVPLRSVLIEELGVPKLLDVYTNIAVEYNASLESIIKDNQTTFADPNDYKTDLEKNKTGQSSNNFKLDTLQFNPPTRYFSAPSVLAQDSKDGANHNQGNTAPAESPSSARRVMHPNTQGTPRSAASPPGTISTTTSTGTNPSTGEPLRARASSLIKHHPPGLPRAGNQTPTAGASTPTLTPTSSSARPSIPILKIPLRSDSVQTLNTRSSRRENGGANSVRSSVDLEFVQAPSKQLSDLATKLGETYMATDLTALLSYKQAMEAHHSRMAGLKGYVPKKLVVGDGKEAILSSPIRPEVATLRASNAYKVKSSILKVLVALTSQPSLLKYIRSPINILYTELIEIYQSLVLADGDFKNLLYQLLFNWADYVEYLHRNRWREITKGMGTDRKIHFRKKLDKFLWRVHNNIGAHMETGAYTEVNVLLAMLGDYMSNCPTRVMSSQVVDVCMESLLKMKHLVFTRGKFTTLRLNDFRLMHNMLVVFDEVASQNMHLPLNDLLLALFVERDDTLSHIKDYMSVVLFGSTLENEIGKDATSKVTITDYRVRVIRHFEVCIDMIRQQADTIRDQSGSMTPLSEESPPKHGGRGGLGSSREFTPNATSGEHHSSSIESLLKKLEFLLNPGSGYILQFLYQGSHYDNFAVKKHMLQLLCKIFELRGNPFVRKKSYVDAYVSYFYIRFIKLYQNDVLDPPTIELCQLHLRLLLAFSLCKTERIAMKFYQLKTMDFLVREISLEYEVKLNRESKDAVPFYLSSKFQKAKGKTDTTSFPPPPNRPQPQGAAVPPPEAENKQDDEAGEKKDDKKEDGKSTEGQDASSPPREPTRKLSFKLNLPGSITQSDPAENRKSIPLLKMPTKEQSVDTSQEAPFKPVSILRPSKGDTSPPSSSNEESPVVSKSKPPMAPLNLTNILPPSSVASPPADPPAPIKPTVPKLGLGSLSTNSSPRSTSAPTTDPTPPATVKPIIPKLGLALSSPSPPSSSGSSPMVPSLKLGGLARDSPPHSAHPPSPSGSGAPLPSPASKLSLKVSNPISPKPKLMDPVASTPMKKAAIPALKLPPGRLKQEKDEPPHSESLSSRPLNGLSAMEQKIDVHDPKFQLLLDNPTHQTFSFSEKSSQFPGRPITPADLLAENIRYNQERDNRKIYHAKDLHIAFLRLIFSMLLTQNYTLEPLYSDQFPVVAKKLNIPYILHLHINHPQNEAMVSELVSATQSMGIPYFRLLKLLFIKIFNPLLYDDLERVATGAYGTVYKTKLIHKENTEIAVKLMAVPKSIHDRCVLHDIFTEILILDKFKNDPRCCHLYDYGVDGDSYWIIMKSYKSSLKEWRLRQNQIPFVQALPLYLNIFMSILNAVKFLVETKVNHFDIKCDNFLLHPKHQAISDHDFWTQPSHEPNFNVVLADFGEAKIYSLEVDGYTTRNRGTEFIKSPEMLTVAYASQKTRDAYDRRKQVGSNSASDVWSIGCLLYELLTGEFLFYDDDWVRFFIRVTSPGQELLTEEKKAKMGNITPLIEFLDFIFIRDPFYRPTINDVITKFTLIKPSILQHLAASERAVDRATRERSASVYTNVPRTPTHLSMGRRDTIGEKYTTREPTSSRYSPGRYTPHLAQPPSFRLHTPHQLASSQPPRPITPQSQSSHSHPHSQLASSSSSQVPSSHAYAQPVLSPKQPTLQPPIQPVHPASLPASPVMSDPPESLPVPSRSHPLAPSSQPSSPTHVTTPTHAPIPTPASITPIPTSAPITNHASAPSQPPQPKTQPSQQIASNRHVVMTPPKATPRDSPFDLPPDPPIELEFPEHEYFMRAPSQITPFLYVSSYNPSLDRPMLKHKLHITHIINCTGSPNAFPDHFEYLHLKLHDENSQEIVTSLQRVFDFIRDGHLHKGRVLIFSDKGISRSIALCVAYLMDSYSLTYLEAYLYVRDRRYISAPNPGFVEQLCKWSNDKRRGIGTVATPNGNGVEMPLDALFGTVEASPVTWWQCYCGACTFALNGTFDNSKFQNPRSCCCMMDEPSDCPYIGCSTFLEEMKKLHDFNAEGIVWGYASQRSILMDNLERHTVEVQPLKGVPMLMLPQVTRKDWRVFRCRTCQFLTHALSTQHPPSSSSSAVSFSPGSLVAIVTNIPRHSLR